MRIALVDDSEIERGILLSLITDYGCEKQILFESDCFDSGDAFLSSFSSDKYDIVFVDIFMNGMSGVETASKMRQIDSHVILIFLTASADYMPDAFRVHAFHYILKPYQKDAIFACLNDASLHLPASETFISFSVNAIYEPGLDELMQENMLRLTFTVDYQSAYKDAQVIFIGVGTPEKKDGSANLNYVYKVAEQIAESVEHECVVVVKSTVPIGTNDKIETYMIEHLKNHVQIHIASNPEFLAQGTAVHDTLHASRIVIGAESDYAKTVLEKVYENFEAPKVITNRRSAEMIKYASNDFLALKISYVNEIANLCEIVGADIEDVTRGMGFDARIGDKFLNSGIGYGGSCFPKDTKALSWLASFNDNEIKTIKAAIEANPGVTLILHSDRGFQYTSKTFKKKLEKQKMTQSMSRIGHCIDNGPTEGFWGIIKSEMYHMHEITDEKSLRTAISDYIGFYSEKRPQDRYNCKTPLEVRQEGLASDNPTEYPIPENKRINKYKEKWCA